MKKYNKFNNEMISEDLINETDEVQAPKAERESMEVTPRNAVVDNCTFLNIREYPDMTADIKTTIKKGTKVRIIRTNVGDGYCKLDINGSIGYAPYKFFTEV